MFDRLVQLIEQSTNEPPPPEPADHRLAVATLLVEAARMDHTIAPDERDRIAQLLQWRFELDELETDGLLDQAIAAAEDSHSLHRYSLAIRTHFEEAERITVIELLWDIAYIDGHLHEREASLMRKLAGLLYVTDQDSGAARKRVQARLGISQD